MNKRVLVLLIVVGVIFAGSVAAVIWGLRAPESQRVEVVQDGRVLYTFDLSIAENQSVRIETGGSYNIITIADGEIFVSEAGCPDQTCVRTGVLRSENLPIVCLPNKLVIRFA